MPVSIDTVATIKLDGAKGTWRVPQKSIIQIDGVNYVRLEPYTFTLVKMVCEQAVGLPNPIPKSLTHSVGYKSLVRLRNDAHQREFISDQPTPNRSLFGGDCQPTARPRKRICRDKVRELREQPRTIDIEVEPTSGGEPLQVSVLRPIHALDCLTVKLCETTLGVVFDTIINGGFDAPEESRSLEEHPRPKGIWKRGKGFIVPYAVDGIAKYKLRPSIDAAVEFQSEFDTGSASNHHNEPLQGGCEIPLADGSPQ